MSPSSTKKEHGDENVEPPHPEHGQRISAGIWGKAKWHACGRVEGCEGTQVILPILSLFTLFRPYLAHFCPVFSRFLRVSTAWPRRFQQAPSRSPGPRNGGKGAKSGELRPSFDAPDANQRINWQFGEICGVNIPNQAAEHYYLITEPMDAVSRHSYRWHLGCILLKMPAISLLTGRPGVARRRGPG